MKSRRSLRDLIVQLIVWCDEAAEMVDGVTLEAFRADRRTQYATAKCIEEIGEASRRILQGYPEAAQRYPDLPLAETYRMRNRLAHAYEQVDLDIVWESARTGARDLSNRLRAALADLDADRP